MLVLELVLLISEDHGITRLYSSKSWHMLQLGILKNWPLDNLTKMIRWLGKRRRFYANENFKQLVPNLLVTSSEKKKVQEDAFLVLPVSCPFQAIKLSGYCDAQPPQSPPSSRGVTKRIQGGPASWRIDYIDLDRCRGKDSTPNILLRFLYPPKRLYGVLLPHHNHFYLILSLLYLTSFLSFSQPQNGRKFLLRNAGTSHE